MAETALPPEDVQSYPRPPALEPAGPRLEVWLGETLVAATDRGLRVLETHHAPTYYLPPADVSARLVPTSGASLCEWKGRARYFDVAAGAAVARRAAWSYATPTARFAALKDHVAFYPGLMSRCLVGGVEVLPQPGDFYGGWVTPNLGGIVKGAPGTLGW